MPCRLHPVFADAQSTVVAHRIAGARHDLKVRLARAEGGGLARRDGSGTRSTYREPVNGTGARRR
jgi:hypothetical protein